MVQDIRPSGSPFKRLFFALPVSDAQRRALAQWRRGLGLRSGKPVPAANFHVTLLFLGDVDTARCLRSVRQSINWRCRPWHRAFA